MVLVVLSLVLITLRVSFYELEEALEKEDASGGNCCVCLFKDNVPTGHIGEINIKKQSLSQHIGEINIKKQPLPTADSKGPVPAAEGKKGEQDKDVPDDESLSSRSSASPASFRSSSSETTEEIPLKD